MLRSLVGRGHSALVPFWYLLVLYQLSALSSDPLVMSSGLGRRMSGQWTRIRYPPRGQPSQGAPSVRQRPTNYRNSALSSVSRWPNRVVVYTVDRSLEQIRPLIGRAIREIESRTCIRFRRRQGGGDSDFVQIVNGRGCHSKVGRTGGRQLLSLGSGCHDVGSVLHELSHAIGLYHEHMRWDRDQFLNIIWGNILPSMYDQFQKIPFSQYRPATNFDYNSIMMYGNRAFTKNGGRTMVPRDSRARITESHFKQTLSPSDVININSLYGCNQ